MSVPAVIEGNVLTPDHVTQGVSYPAKDFFNVLRDLVHKVTYHAENDRLAALSAIDGYESHVIPRSDQAAVVAEDHRAPSEDVTQRRAPGLPVATAPGQIIDYGKLAAAIVAAQAAQSNQVHEVTDVAPAYNPEG